MELVVQGLLLLAMVGAALFGFLALAHTGQWAARRLESTRKHHDHSG